MLLAAFALLGLAPLPPNITMSLTDRSLTLASDGDVISTALLCPGFAFDTFGAGGPRLSPDQHWVLVDIRGPYTPGNVPRNHALINVHTGAVIASPDFPAVLGIATAPDGLAWVSGERSTLRYATQKTVVLHDPIARAVPHPRCTAEPVGCARSRLTATTRADRSPAPACRDDTRSTEEPRAAPAPGRI